MAMATPPPGKSNTSCSITWPSSPSHLIVSLPLPGTTKSVARYWSPKAWRPMMIGWVQPGTRRGTFLQMIGSRKTTPPRMLRMVPLGDFHICLRLNSFTRASSGVMVAHLMPTPHFLIACGRVDRHLVVGGVAVLDAEVVVLDRQVEERQDQLVLDQLPDDAGHLVAVEVDDGVRHLDLGHADLRTPARRNGTAAQPGAMRRAGQAIGASAPAGKPAARGRARRVSRSRVAASRAASANSASRGASVAVDPTRKAASA